MGKSRNYRKRNIAEVSNQPAATSEEGKEQPAATSEEKSEEQDMARKKSKTIADKDSSSAGEEKPAAPSEEKSAAVEEKSGAAEEKSAAAEQKSKQDEICTKFAEVGQLISKGKAIAQRAVLKERNSRMRLLTSFNVSFDNFPYFLSDVTKNALIAFTFMHVTFGTTSVNTIFWRNLSISFPRVLLCGPTGCETYADDLMRALANHYKTSLLVVEFARSRDASSLKTSINDAFKAATEEMTKSGSIILLVKGIEELLSPHQDVYEAFRKKLEALQGKAVVVALHTVPQVEKVELTWLKKLNFLFPNKVTIKNPQHEHDERVRKDWNDKLDRDVRRMTLKKNSALLCSILRMLGFDCLHVEDLHLTDEALSRENAEKVVGLALSKYFMDSDCPVKAGGTGGNCVLISKEFIEYGFDLLQGSRDDNLKSLNDVITDNEYEKKLLAEVSPPGAFGVTFKDIGALEKVKQTLEELVMLPLQRPELFGRGQLRKSCKGILLFGPPGTGKTMLAKAVATESGAYFMNVTIASCTSMYYGEGEKYVKAIFTLASKLSPCVIFIDEVDSILGRRGEEHETARKMKNEFLIQWEGLLTNDEKRLLVLAATNRPYDLDEAVIRRLPRRLMVGLPDALNREKILRVILATEVLGPDVDLNAVAKMTDGYSGSDLKNLCGAAAYNPLRELVDKEKKEEMALALEERKQLQSLRRSSDLRYLQMDDFKLARKEVSASVQLESDNMRKLLQWNKLYGGGGGESREETMLSYFF